MQTDQHEKNLEPERMVFFSDAMLAVAITLLALELKVQPAGPHFAFADILHAWHKFAASFLSFITFMFRRAVQQYLARLTQKRKQAKRSEKRIA